MVQIINNKIICFLNIYYQNYNRRENGNNKQQTDSEANKTSNQNLNNPNETCWISRIVYFI
jgi:hypothetical protein